MESPFFAMRNNHLKGCGEPPVFRNVDSSRYYGYYENELGEQWVFVYDRERKIGELRGGEAGWGKAIPVTNGVAIGLTIFVFAKFSILRILFSDIPNEK